MGKLGTHEAQAWSMLVGVILCMCAGVDGRDVSKRQPLERD